MSESYVECLVEKRTSSFMLFLKYLLYGLTLVTFFLGFGGGIWIFLLAAIAFGVAAYFVTMNAVIEYEYLYLDKEITVDKIMNRNKRKRVGVYEVDKIEIMAPINSYHLDGFKNRNFRVVDISRGIEDKPDRRYVFFYNGTDKIIFEPNEELVKAVKNVSPRKTFMD